MVGDRSGSRYGKDGPKVISVGFAMVAAGDEESSVAQPALTRSSPMRTARSKTRMTIDMNITFTGTRHPEMEEETRLTAHRIKLIVRTESAHICQPITHCEERCNRAYFPDVILGQTVLQQGLPVLFTNTSRVERYL